MVSKMKRVHSRVEKKRSALRNGGEKTARGRRTQPGVGVGAQREGKRGVSSVLCAI